MRCLVKVWEPSLVYDKATVQIRVPAYPDGFQDPSLQVVWFRLKEEICPGSHLDKAICLPISVLYCAYSPHSADKGPRTEKSCTGVTNFYAMLKRSLNHCSQHSNEPPRHRFFCLAFAARLSDNQCVYYLTFTTPCTQDRWINRQKPCVEQSVCLSTSDSNFHMKHATC